MKLANNLLSNNQNFLTRILYKFYTKKIVLFITLISYAFSSYGQDFLDEQNAITPVTVEYYFVQKGETLYKIANAFDLGFDEVLQANPHITNPHHIYVGEKIILPIAHLIPDVARKGIVINLAESRLYFFSNSKIISFPVSIGAEEKTPTGKTRIIAKRENPAWTPPQSIREENPNLPDVVPPGPDNPLGNYALYLDSSRNAKWQNIVIHGTNAQWSIGSRVSHGCIRLYAQDIERLFDMIEIDTPVAIINQPIKVSQFNENVYLESHLKTAPDLVSEDIGVKKLICQKIKDCDIKIDWPKVDDAILQNLGIPVNISNNLQ